MSDNFLKQDILRAGFDSRSNLNGLPSVLALISTRLIESAMLNDWFISIIKRVV